jgi:hypothetical protein
MSKVKKVKEEVISSSPEFKAFKALLQKNDCGMIATIRLGKAPKSMGQEFTELEHCQIGVNVSNSLTLIAHKSLKEDAEKRFDTEDLQGVYDSVVEMSALEQMVGSEKLDKLKDMVCDIMKEMGKERKEDERTPSDILAQIKEMVEGKK